MAIHNLYKEQHRYDDIINLPHHVSAVHPHMPLSDRAAQFSPFAALSGYHDAVEETARFTDEKRELDENNKAILDRKLQMIQENKGSPMEISITYFQADAKKSGGAYVTAVGAVKRIDPSRRILIMDNGLAVPVDDIVDLALSCGNSGE